MNWFDEPEDPKKPRASAKAKSSDPYVSFAEKLSRSISQWQGYTPEQVLANARDVYNSGDRSRLNAMYDAMRLYIPEYRDKTREEMDRDPFVIGFLRGGLQRETTRRTAKAGATKSLLPDRNGLLPDFLAPKRPTKPYAPPTPPSDKDFGPQDLRPRVTLGEKDEKGFPLMRENYRAGAKSPAARPPVDIGESESNRRYFMDMAAKQREYESLVPDGPKPTERPEQKEQASREYEEHDRKMREAQNLRLQATAENLETQAGILGLMEMMRAANVAQSAPSESTQAPLVPNAMREPVMPEGTGIPQGRPIDPGSVMAAIRRMERTSPVIEPPTLTERAKSAGGSFMQGLTSTVAGMPEAIAVTAKQLDDFFGTGEYEGKPATELATYKAGQWLREKAKELFPTDPRVQREFIAGTLAQGAGNMIGFLLGGAAGRGSKAGAALASALIGGGTMGAEEYRRALEETKDPEKAWKAFVENVGWGTTEAIPIANILGRVNKATGGEAKKILAQMFRNGWKGSIEEGLQELGQQLGSNWSAQRIYDARRSLMDGTLEGALAGAILGGAMSAAGTGVGASIQQAKIDDLQWNPEEYARQFRDKNAVKEEYYDPATGQRLNIDETRKARQRGKTAAQQEELDKAREAAEDQSRTMTAIRAMNRREGQTVPEIVGSNLPPMEIQEEQDARAIREDQRPEDQRGTAPERGQEPGRGDRELTPQEGRQVPDEAMQEERVGTREEIEPRILPKAANITAEDFEINPELAKNYTAPAMLEGETVHPARKGEMNHADIAERLGFPENLIPGFINQDGDFEYQYEEDVPTEEAEPQAQPQAAEPEAEPASQVPDQASSAEDTGEAPAKTKLSVGARITANGQEVEGTYGGYPFSGKVRRIRPNESGLPGDANRGKAEIVLDEPLVGPYGSKVPRTDLLIDMKLTRDGWEVVDTRTEAETQAAETPAEPQTPEETGVTPPETETAQPAPESGAKPVRYEAGRNLTPDEKREVLRTLGDSYVDLGHEKVLKGHDKRDEPIYGYPYDANYQYTSDITGRKIRHYITLPDGRKAHPTELYPNITQAEIDRAALEVRHEAEQKEKRRQMLLSEAEKSKSVADANRYAMQRGIMKNPAETVVMRRGENYIRVQERDVETLKNEGFSEFIRNGERVEQPAERPAGEDVQADDRTPPKDENQYISRADHYRWMERQGNETPAEPYPHPVGTWRIDDMNLNYGRAIEQLREVPVAELEYGEESPLTQPGKPGYVDRYRKWYEEGKQPPPIEVVELDDGTLRIVNGHRRAEAAKQAGVETITAWVSDGMDTGKRDSEGNPITAPLTYEGMMYGPKKAEEIAERARRGEEKPKPADPARTPHAETGMSKRDHANAIRQAIRSGELDPIEARRLHEGDYPRIAEWKDYRNANPPQGEIRWRGRNLNVYRSPNGYELRTKRENALVTELSPREYETEISRRTKAAQAARKRAENVTFLTPEQVESMPAVKALQNAKTGNRDAGQLDGIRVLIDPKKGESVVNSRPLVDRSADHSDQLYETWQNDPDERIRMFGEKKTDPDELVEAALTQIAALQGGKDYTAALEDHMAEQSQNKFIDDWNRMPPAEKKNLGDYRELSAADVANYDRVRIRGEWMDVEVENAQADPKDMVVTLRGSTDAITLSPVYDSDVRIPVEEVEIGGEVLIPENSDFSKPAPKPPVMEEENIPFSRRAEIPTDPDELARATAERLRAMGKRDDPLFMFAGPKAETARFLGAAKHMERQGKDAEEIRIKTGWQRGIDGRWKWEISDDEASLNLDNLPDTGKKAGFKDEYGEPAPLRYGYGVLGNYLNHPALFEAYPRLKTMDVRITIDPTLPRSKQGAEYHPGAKGDRLYKGRTPEIVVRAATDAQALSSLLHEIQHGIQHYEGFAMGGDFYQIRKDMLAIEEMIDGINEEMSRLVPKEGEMTPDARRRYNELMDERSRLARKVNESVDPETGTIGYRTYRRMAGEIESRATESRRRMGPTMRRYVQPQADEDILRENAIVSFNGEEAWNAPPPANAVEDAPHPKSRAFKTWFGESVVVDKDGKPRVMYHGTQDDFDAFRLGEIKSGAIWGRGFYFTESAEDAEHWAEYAGGDAPSIMPVYVRMENPLDIDSPADKQEFMRRLEEAGLDHYLNDDARAWLQDEYVDEEDAARWAKDNLSELAEMVGYDGVMGTYFGGVQHYMVFSPTQIKSATGNRGTYDPDDPSILHSVRENLDLFAEDGNERREPSELEKYGAKHPDQVAAMERKQRAEKAKARRAKQEEELSEAKAELKQLQREAEFDPASEETARKIREVQTRIAKLRIALDEDMFDIRAAEDQGTLFSRRSEPALASERPGAPRPFYSQLRRTAEEKLPGKGSGLQYKQMFEAWQKKGEFKAEELEWSGLLDWLASQGRMTKQDVLDFLDQNEVEIEEVVYGETEPDAREVVSENVDDWDYWQEFVNAEMSRSEWEAMSNAERTDYAMSVFAEDPWIYSDERLDAPKYGDWRLKPEGENYREIIFSYNPKLKSIQDPDVTGWTVETLREIPTGQREVRVLNAEGKWLLQRSGTTLSDEELIADAAKTIREMQERVAREDNVYRSTHWHEIPNTIAHARYDDRIGPSGDRLLHIDEFQSDRYLSWKQGENVPDAPFFKTNWYEFVFKRLLRHAVENGYDGITWTAGEQQVDRYDLSKRVKIEYERTSTENFHVYVTTPRGEFVFENEVVTPEELPGIVGKEIAERMMQGEGVPFEGIPGNSSSFWAELAERGRPVRVFRKVDEKLRVTEAAAPHAYLLFRGDTYMRTIQADSMEEAESIAQGMPQWFIEYEKGEPMGTWLTEGAAQAAADYQREIIDRMGKRGKGARLLQGDDLKIGGEGKRTFYDQIIPKFIQKYTKKWGGKVGKIRIGGMAEEIPLNYVDVKETGGRNNQPPYNASYVDETEGKRYNGCGETEDEAIQDLMDSYEMVMRQKTAEVWHLPITEAMRESVMQGQPLFSRSRTYTEIAAEEARLLPWILKDTPDTFRERWNTVQGLKQDGQYFPGRDEYQKEFGRPMGVDLHELGHRFFIRYAPAELHDGMIMAASRMDKILGRTSIERILERLGGREYATAEDRQRFGNPAEWVRDNYSPDLFGYEMEAELFRLVAETRGNARTTAENLAGRILKFAPEGFRNWTVDKLADMLFGAYKMALNIRKQFGSEAAEYRAAVADFITGNNWKKHDAVRYPGMHRMDEATKDHLVALGIQVWKDGNPMYQDWVREMKRRIREADRDAEDVLIPYLEKTYRGVREAMTGEQEPMYVVPFHLDPESYTDTFVRLVQDEWNRVLRLQREIAKAGGVVDEDADAYVIEELHKGKIEERLNDVKRDFIDPLAKRIAEARKNGVTERDIFDYLYASHAQERNEYIATINPNMPDGGAGGDWTTDHANRVLETLKDKEEYLRPIAEIVWSVNAFDRTIRKADIEDPDRVNAWEKLFEHYVPLRRDENPMNLGTGYGGGRLPRQKAATGRTTEAENLIEYSLNQLMNTIVRDGRNEVKKAVMRLAVRNPNPEIWEVDKHPTEPRVRQVWKVVDGAGKSYGSFPFERLARIKRNELGQGYEVVPGQEVQMVPESNYMNRDDVMVVRINGVDHTVEIKDKILARQINRLYAAGNNSAVDRAFRAIAPLTRWVASLATQYNPEFVFTNPIRDIQEGLINITSEKGAKYASQVAREIPRTMRQLWAHLLFGKENETSRVYDQYKRAGGKVAYIKLEDVAELQQRMMREVDRLVYSPKDRPFAAVGRMAQSMIGVIDNLNEGAEQATRLAVFKVLIANGFSEQEAGSYSKNFTVNFNRKGELSYYLNVLKAFFNVGVQGPARMIKALHTKRGKALIVGLGIAGYLNSILNHMIAGDDDDGVNYYDKIPVYKKDVNWTLITGKEGEYKTLPLPYGYNFFYGIGQWIGDLQWGAKPSDVLVRAIEAALQSFNPIGNGPIEQLIMPTFMEPLTQITTNKNFFGGPIRPDQKPWEPTRPQSELAFPSVNPTAQAMARWMNEATGGSEFRPGWVEKVPLVGEYMSNPENIEHMVEFALGGTGKFVNNSIQTAQSLYKGEDPEPRKIPFFRRYSGRVDDYITEQTFYTALDVVAQYQDELEAEADRADAKASNVIAWNEKHPWYGELVRRVSSVRDYSAKPKNGEYPVWTAEKVRKMVSEFAKKVRAAEQAYENEEDPAKREEIRKQAERLQTEKMDLIKWFLRQYNEARDKQQEAQ